MTTSNAFIWAQPTGLRRATFVPSPAGVTARRVYVLGTVGAAFTSVLTVGVIVPLVF